MAKQLTTEITNQISRKHPKPISRLSINGTDYTAYLINWQVSYDKAFGSASATFTLNNNNGIFGDGGASTINIGDIVSLTEQYSGDTTEWKSFYGQVKSRAINKEASSRTITLVCLDYISLLQNWDINLSRKLLW